jgi:FtsH-binding integral membrane protein
MDMQQAVSARTPAHLWIVGILALLWNCFGCLDYTMTNLKNQAWLAQMTADQRAFMDSLPSWLTAFWALGVWGGLVGSILLLMRNRYAVWAYAISCVGAVVGLGYQIAIAKMPASMKAGAMGLLPWGIILITIILLWYAMNAQKKGVLR